MIDNNQGSEINWREYAYCKGTDPGLFYPITNKQQAEVAKVCGHCVVRNECLEYALENKEYGVWGGTTERQRRDINKDRRVS